MTYGSIYRVTDADAEVVEGQELTEAQRMKQRFPNAGHKNSGNYIFAGFLADAINPFNVGDLVNAEGEKLTGDALVLEVGKEMAKDVRDRAIHLSKADAVAMAKSPIWRLWTKDYDAADRTAFEADYLAAKALFPALPAYTVTITYQQAADWLLAGIKSI